MTRVWKIIGTVAAILIAGGVLLAGAGLLTGASPEWVWSVLDSRGHLEAVKNAVGGIQNVVAGVLRSF